MADARLTISYRFNFGDMIRQLREAADRLEGLQDAVDGEATPPLQDAPEETPRLIKVDGILAEGDADTAREVLRQMGADPHGLKTGMVVQSYVDHGDRKWVFRCWGTDDGCDGLLSLDHSSQSSAECARDRHLTEARAQDHHTWPGPWTVDHQLSLLVQIESRPGPLTGDDEQWMERHRTGKALVVCQCGYTSGLIDRPDRVAYEEIAAQHPPTLVPERG